MADGRRRVLVTAVAAGLAVALAGPAAAAGSGPDVDRAVATWDDAAAGLGTAGSLWEPGSTAQLTRHRRITILADGLAFADGLVTAGDTYAGTRYGTARRGFQLDEKWADTGWAAEPALSTSMARVGSVRIRLGPRGAAASVVAQVYANCFAQPADRDPKPIPRRFRCAPADVLSTGGVLMLTARPASQMSAPGRTTVVLQSTGLTYRELVGVARSLEQVAGAPIAGAGSAQMVAMCRQMVDGRMAFDQADAFARSNGYSARVGSVDGVPQPVTSDYRPDRFTVALVGGAVTGCTYG
jgi:hypothetical protein